VAVDSRIELFSDDVWQALDRIEGGDPGWQDALARWNPTVVVASASDTALAARRGALGWQIVESDGDGMVLIRAV
jgi:hypothetical protein